jgi:hypothetical protein
MNAIEIVATAVKEGAHSFEYIRKTTGLPLSDEQLMELIQENGDRLQFTRIRREDPAGNRIRPGWPGVKLRGVATG